MRSIFELRTACLRGRRVLTAGALVSGGLLLAPLNAAASPESTSVANNVSAEMGRLTVDRLGGDDLASLSPFVSKLARRDGLVSIQAADGSAAVADLSLAGDRDPQRRAMWSANRDAVRLSWGSIPTASAYRVSRDGVVVATVKGTDYTDSRVSVGEHAYKVETVLAAGAPLDSGQTWGWPVTVPAAAPTDTSAIQSTSDSMAASASAISNSEVIFDAFIPQQYVASGEYGLYPCAYGSNYVFGGDNRGWSPTSGSYRARETATVNWNSGASVDTGASPGTTHVYLNSTKTLVAAKTAGSGGLTVKALAGGSSTAQYIHFNMQAQDPFCTSLPDEIDGAFTIEVTTAGSWSIRSGTLKQMPDNEIWVGHLSNGGDSWIYTAAEEIPYLDASCLVSLSCQDVSLEGQGKY